MADEVKQEKIEEPKVENANKIEKVYKCIQCVPEGISGGCRWDEAEDGPLQIGICVPKEPFVKGKTPVWFVEEKEEKKEEATSGEPTIAEALDKHGIAIAIPEELKAKMSEELLAAVEAGAPVVVILDRAEDHATFTISSHRDFRKGFSLSKSKTLNQEQVEQLQQDFDELIKVQKHLHDRIRAVERENEKGQDDIKKARAVLKEMEDMKTAKAAAEEAAAKEHEDWFKMFRDHKNMKEKLTKTTTALQDIRNGVKELHDRFIH